MSVNFCRVTEIETQVGQHYFHFTLLSVWQSLVLYHEVRYATKLHWFICIS